MDVTTLRRLATQLQDELPAVIPDDAERASVADAITTALAASEGESQEALLKALAAHPATRAWMRGHGAAEDAFRGGLPGSPGMLGDTTAGGLYYVCPREDEDAILLVLPAQPPLCPNHGIPMTLQG
jgi:hypothetical protein